MFYAYLYPCLYAVNIPRTNFKIAIRTIGDAENVNTRTCVEFMTTCILHHI